MMTGLRARASLLPVVTIGRTYRDIPDFMTSPSSVSSHSQPCSRLARPDCGPLGRLVLFAMAGLLGGCAVLSPPPVPRGAMLDKEDYGQLVVGTSTRNDVVGVIGTPTTRATFDDNTWYYIAMTKDLVPLSHPAVDTQRVLVLNFDNRGTLQHMTMLHKKNAVPVDMVSDETKTPGTHISVIQELLGNVGRYNPLTSMGSTFGSTGGVPSNNSTLGGQGTGNGGVGNVLP